MVFSSLIFVFLFFTANIITQAVVTDMRKKNIVMLAFSLVFYAWGGIQYVPLLMGMTFICWYSALLIARRRSQHDRKLALILVLLILGIFKYTGFFLRNVQLLLGFPKVIPEIMLPIGISFYTFQLLSYVIDVYRGDAEVQEKYWLLLLYASLFHQCVAGPIVRYRDVNQDILHRRVKMTELSRGITRFTVGLAKKAVLANGCAVVADTLLAAKGLAEQSVLGTWVGMIAFTLQIYLDFSAYSDMAIGMGLMCGFHYQENFNYPYAARSVTDFWRRWHISLSSWFRDYVYIPLGGNRVRPARHLFNLFAVWLLTGLWHGANWTFLLWGLAYFVLLMLEKYTPLQRLPSLLGRAYTLLAVGLCWVLFRAVSLGAAGEYLRALFFRAPCGLWSGATSSALTNGFVYFLLGGVLSFPLVPWLKKRRFAQRPAAQYLAALFQLLVFLLTVGFILSSTYDPFIYFNF